MIEAIIIAMSNIFMAILLGISDYIPVFVAKLKNGGDKNETEGINRNR